MRYGGNCAIGFRLGRIYDAGLAKRKPRRVSAAGWGQGSASILLRKHDRQHAGRLRRISRVFRAELHRQIVIMHLEEELPAREREAPEIVLLVGIVVGLEFRERR